MNGLARGSDRRLHFLPVRIFTQPPIVFTVFGTASCFAGGRDDPGGPRGRPGPAALRAAPAEFGLRAGRRNSAPDAAVAGGSRL
jgi:hypothetical protein